MLASFFFCVFMDLDSVLVHKHAQKELGQYPAILTPHLVNKYSPTEWIEIFSGVRWRWEALQDHKIISKNGMKLNCNLQTGGWAVGKIPSTEEVWIFSRTNYIMIIFVAGSGRSRGAPPSQFWVKKAGRARTHPPPHLPSAPHPAP